MNKPVAWMNYVEHSDFYDLNISGRGIPLYTHPVKELTDEEIDKIENKVYLTTIAKGKPLGAYSKELVKAILRKAQEK